MKYKKKTKERIEIFIDYFNKDDFKAINGLNNKFNIFNKEINASINVNCKNSKNINNYIKNIEKYKPDYIHLYNPQDILCRNVIKYCNKNNIPYTTSLTRIKFSSLNFINKYFRKIEDFHKQSSNVLVPYFYLKNYLKDKGIYASIWNSSVDRAKFNPVHRIENNAFVRPILLYVGKIDDSENIEDFLKLKIKGQKIVVGDGPKAMEIVKKYPFVKFTGILEEYEMPELYATSDVLVISNKIDVPESLIMESIFSGTPVAAYNVPGPQDFIKNGINGYIGNNLSESILSCLQLNREDVYLSSTKWSWNKSFNDFYKNLVYTGL